MSTENFDEFDDLMGAALATRSEDEKVAITEDAIRDEEGGSGVDWDKIFFDAEIGKTYVVKFLRLLKAPNKKDIQHAEIYTGLPDPDYKDSTLRYVSFGRKHPNAPKGTDPVLQVFFDLKKREKGGCGISEQKISKYLSRRSLNCCLVQILEHPDPEMVGAIRLMTFQMGGDGATITLALDAKMNPTRGKRVDVFDLFETPAMEIICEEKVFPSTNGGEPKKGRSFAKSKWIDGELYSAIGIIRDEEGKKIDSHEFKKADLDEKGNVKPELMKYFKALISEMVSPDVDIYNWFLPKISGDPRNTEDTEARCKEIEDKLERMLPILRDGSLSDIATMGKGENPNKSGGDKSASASKNATADELPDEFKDSVMSENGEGSGNPFEEKKADTPPPAADSGIDPDVAAAMS